MDGPLLTTLMLSPPGVGAIDDHRVGQAVALAGPRGCREVDGDLGHIGAGEVVDDDGVGTAKGVERDVLDVVEVHDHVADIARQPHALAIGGDLEDLIDIGAIEQKRIAAVLTLDNVAAVAGIPDKGVIAAAEQGGVVAAATSDGVAAVAADQQIAAGTAGDGVIASAAIDDHFDLDVRCVDDVVAAEAVDGERVVGSFHTVNGDFSRQPFNRNAGAGVDDRDVVGGCRAVDDDGVGLAVADAAAGRCRQVQSDLFDIGLAEVVHRDRIGTAECHEFDPLDVVEVHVDRGDVALE